MSSSRHPTPANERAEAARISALRRSAAERLLIVAVPVAVLWLLVAVTLIY